MEFWRTSAASPNSDDGVGDIVTVRDGVVLTVAVVDILGLCEVVIEGLIEVV